MLLTDLLTYSQRKVLKMLTHLKRLDAKRCWWKVILFLKSLYISPFLFCHGCFQFDHKLVRIISPSKDADKPTFFGGVKKKRKKEKGFQQLSANLLQFILYQVCDQDLSGWKCLSAINLQTNCSWIYRSNNHNKTSAIPIFKQYDFSNPNCRIYK